MQGMDLRLHCFAFGFGFSSRLWFMAVIGEAMAFGVGTGF